MRRAAKQNARKRSRRIAENLFYKHSNPKSTNQADQFSDDELQTIGLGYDRSVRFMEKNDPNLRHPHDWYKYGQYGPYSWRGIVVGHPIRGRFSDDRVTIIGEVKDHEEWEKIEKHEMKVDFGDRMTTLIQDATHGFRFYWVFVRHPKWKPFDPPHEQWTIVSEVAIVSPPPTSSSPARLDKWTLMGRLGNKTRALITQCAAWFRPDIIYVKRPVYQCRFEPQDNFFKLLGPLLDPVTENQFLFERKDPTGVVIEICTYFAGLCKIVKIRQKAFVDDVVRAFDKLDDVEKSTCLDFLLTNHPLDLLHPYTKEWKAKMEEEELGCDAPDDDGDDDDETKDIVDWIETSDDEDDELGTDADADDQVIDVNNDYDEGSQPEKEESDPMESEEYWEKQWKEALKNSDKMEDLVKRKMEASSKEQAREMMKEKAARAEEEEEIAVDRIIADVDEEDSSSVGRHDTKVEEHSTKMEKEFVGGFRHRGGGGEGQQRRTRVKKSRIPPELFLRAAVRPFDYRNLVKEIVLLRHAILDKEINPHG